MALELSRWKCRIFWDVHEPRTMSEDVEGVTLIVLTECRAELAMGQGMPCTN
jgi:hypothetical protein